MPIIGSTKNCAIIAVTITEISGMSSKSFKIVNASGSFANSFLSNRTNKPTTKPNNSCLLYTS
ncbi:hypothetical protein KQJ29_38095, partial [Enterococcus sp. S181_ASV_20]|nr:hypothetical protein [Enterococcus sp. S181_ASV_20]